MTMAYIFQYGSSGLIPSSLICARRRWAVELMGRNSVIPSITPRRIETRTSCNSRFSRVLVQTESEIRRVDQPCSALSKRRRHCGAVFWLWQILDAVQTKQLQKTLGSAVKDGTPRNFSAAGDLDQV